MIGHVYSLSTFTATDAPAALPLPPRAPACFGQAPPSEAAEAVVQAEGVTRHDLRTRMPEHAWRKFLAQKCRSDCRPSTLSTRRKVYTGHSPTGACARVGPTAAPFAYCAAHWSRDV